MEETYVFSQSSHLHRNSRVIYFRIYDRKLKSIPPRQSEGFRYRVETLIGITGARMAKYRDSWSTVWWAPFKIVWRPHLLAILLFEVGVRTNIVMVHADLMRRLCCLASALVLT